MVALGCKQTLLFPVQVFSLFQAAYLYHSHVHMTCTCTYSFQIFFTLTNTTHRLGQPPPHFQSGREKDPLTTKLAGSHPCLCLMEVAAVPAWSCTPVQCTWQPAHLVLALYTHQLQLLVVVAVVVCDLLQLCLFLRV